jgi:S-adenosylmethionine:tRNA ribosyltransferase-isomerase
VSLRTSDYDYELPQELIARYPRAQRDASRMMVLRRANGSLENRTFAEFGVFVGANDMVVLNDTRVIPARIWSDDGKVELLFLEKIERNTWKCLVKPGRKMRVGATIRAAGTCGEVRAICPDGERIIQFDGPVDLESFGELPLPPYLERRAEPADTERYQTIFAREAGAVAAPTAGLHFTPQILASVPHTFITLHVGAGTFRPVQTENIAAHRMHEENYCVSDVSANAINRAEKVFAVGTTCARVLET